MKKFIKLIAKNLAAQTIAFLLLVGFITFAAITWPSQTPAGETSGGKFQSYFNNLKGNCPSGQAVVGINNDFTKKCGDIIQTPTPTPINGVCNTSTRGGCSSGSVYWINNTTSCGTTATWTCKGSNGGTDSSQCSYYNGACTPTTPTCPTNYSYIPVNGVSGCYTLAKVNGENLNCDDTSMVNTWYKEKGRCGDDSGIQHRESELKKDFDYSFNQIMNNYNNNLNSLLCPQGATYITNTKYCKK